MADLPFVISGMTHSWNRFSVKVLLLGFIIFSLYYEAKGAEKCFKCGPGTNDVTDDCSRNVEEDCKDTDQDKFLTEFSKRFQSAAFDHRSLNLDEIDDVRHQHRHARQDRPSSQQFVCTIFINSVTRTALKNCVKLSPKYNDISDVPDGYTAVDLIKFTKDQKGPVPKGLNMSYCRQDLCNVFEFEEMENEDAGKTGVAKCYKCGHGTQDISDNCEDNWKEKCNADDSLNFYNEASAILAKASEVDFRRKILLDQSSNASILLRSWEEKLSDMFGDTQFRTGGGLAGGRQGLKPPRREDQRPFVCARMTNSVIKKTIRNCVRFPGFYRNLDVMPDGIDCPSIPAAKDAPQIPDSIKMCFCKHDLCNLMDSQGRLRGSFAGIILACLFRYYILYIS